MRFVSIICSLIRRDKDKSKEEKEEEEKKQPLSLEEMLAKKAAEQEALSKVRKYSH